MKRLFTMKRYNKRKAVRTRFCRRCDCLFKTTARIAHYCINCHRGTSKEHLDLENPWNKSLMVR